MQPALEATRPVLYCAIAGNSLVFLKVSFNIAVPNATVQGLQSGTYVLQWQAQTTCGGGSATTQNEVNITVNCDASYTLAVPKYRDEYARGDVLATATDPDGKITSATITVGSLPPGMAFNTTTGTFPVISPANLVEGTYRLTVRLVDELGGVTSQPSRSESTGNI